MTQTANVSAHDRLGFTLFMAAVIHALLVLGIGFTVEDDPKPARTLEVTLALYQSKEKPKDADYLAQLNQQGSGTLDEKALPTTSHVAAFQDDVIRDIDRQTTGAMSVEKHLKSSQKQATITTKRRSNNKSLNKMRQGESLLSPTQKPITQPVNLEEEIASLEAKFSKERQMYAKRPRIKRITAASTAQDAGARYKDSWRKKVEKIGNINYPEKARKEKQYGELSLLVAINRDGTLNSVEVITSSGFSVLDDAAIRIVRLAAPFSSFSDDLEDYDLLEIIRTWRFEPSNQLLSY